MPNIQEIEETRHAPGSSRNAVARAMGVSTPKQIADVARPIALRHGVDELYLFGSMARGEGRADSDVDFIYHFSPEANPVVDLVALRNDLHDAFGRDVDLVRKDYLLEPQRDRLRDLQRILFANSVTSKPMFRIV